MTLLSLTRRARRILFIGVPPSSKVIPKSPHAFSHDATMPLEQRREEFLLNEFDYSSQMMMISATASSIYFDVMRKIIRYDVPQRRERGSLIIIFRAMLLYFPRRGARSMLRLITRGAARRKSGRRPKHSRRYAADDGDIRKRAPMAIRRCATAISDTIIAPAPHER